MVHRNAPLSETGRLRLAQCVIDDGWPLRRAAERFQVAVTTAARWSSRYRAEGPAGMADRSSRPHRSPNQTPTRTERRIIKVRVIRRWGPTRIAYLLGLNVSTVHKVLSRYGLARLRWLDRPTGRVIRRMHSPHCGDLVHVDVKKLGKIPAAAGMAEGRSLGRQPQCPSRQKQRRARQVLPSGPRLPLPAHRDRRTLTVGLLRTVGATNAKPPPPRSGYAPTHGSPSTASLLKKVLTDNGSCYRSHAFRDALGEIKHRRTRPYRPQTNGKVERFHRTRADEWAYARLYTSDLERCDEFPRWLHTYNHHRGHTALGGQPPATRIPNLSGQYI